MKSKLILVLVFVFVLSSVASASIITNVDRSRGRGTADADPLASAGGLADGLMVYSDRTYPFANTPSAMLGWEYIRTFNDDKNTSEFDVSYLVTIGEHEQLWIAVDDRLGDEDGDGVIDTDLLLAWVELATYRLPSDIKWVDTDMNLYVHESSTTDRPMSVFVTTTAPLAGSYDFGLNPTGKNFYIIGAVPEPMTIALLGLGGLGLIRRKRS